MVLDPEVIEPARLACAAMDAADRAWRACIAATAADLDEHEGWCSDPCPGGDLARCGPVRAIRDARLRLIPVVRELAKWARHYGSPADYMDRYAAALEDAGLAPGAPAAARRVARSTAARAAMDYLTDQRALRSVLSALRPLVPASAAAPSRSPIVARQASASHQPMSPRPILRPMTARKLAELINSTGVKIGDPTFLRLAARPNEENLLKRLRTCGPEDPLFPLKRGGKFNVDGKIDGDEARRLVKVLSADVVARRAARRRSDRATLDAMAEERNQR